MQSFFLLLGLAMPLFAVRLESTRLAAEASVWFEPNHGQVGGRTEWTARAAGAWLFLTSNEVVYALPPESHFDCFESISPRFVSSPESHFEASRCRLCVPPV